MIPAATTGDFRRAVRRLRAVAPTTRPISVRRNMKHGDNLGEIEKTRRGFLIRIRPDLCLDLMEAILIHEWAHALAWVPDNPLHTDHGPVWGVVHSQVYRAYHGTT